MKESQWRSKLVHLFRQREIKGFIWVHDARFKAGFPDVYTIVHGKACHYELKVARIQSSSYWTKDVKLFEPIQIATLKQIANAGGNARGLILRPDKSVILLDFNDASVIGLSSATFEEMWITRHHL